MKTPDLFRALAISFEWWTNVVVPNVYLGQRSDEMDLAIISKSGLLWEVEIKASLADWRADLSKRKWKPEKKEGWYCPPDGSDPARFYYAVPMCLVKEAKGNNSLGYKYILPDFVPGSAGVLGVYDDDGKPRVRFLRPAKPLHRNPLPMELRLELLRKLGIRYWKHAAPVAGVVA